MFPASGYLLSRLDTDIKREARPLLPNQIASSARLYAHLYLSSKERALEIWSL